MLVEANLPVDSAVWMRSDISANCSTPTQPHALAVIYYPDADRNAIPTSAATPVVDDYCGNVLNPQTSYPNETDLSKG